MKTAVALMLLAGATGCGGRAAGEIEARNPVVGETPAGADAAVYVDLASDGGDALVAARSDDAAMTSLHELRTVEGGGIMWPSERIELVDGTTRLAPFGSHIMLERLERELVAGDTVHVILQFDQHPPIEIDAEVVPLADLAELAD